MRPLLGSCCGLIVWLIALDASAQGISARFGDLVATIGEDVVARVEIDDPKRITARVVVQLRRSGDLDWTDAKAEPPSGSNWWVATFTSTTVWNAGGIRSPQPKQIEARAVLLGKRGGVLLVIGEIEPLIVDVLSAPETKARDQAFAAFGGNTAEEDEFTLTGYVGTEGRVGSSARARAFIGVGGALATNFELLVYVAVGPVFQQPASLDGGPLVLGVDLALRWFARAPYRYTWAAFIEPFGTVDLRLPGVDPGAGMRAGVLLPVSTEVALEVSLGGAVMVFNASDPSGRDAQIGGSAMLRAAVRFGGSSDEDAQ